MRSRPWLVPLLFFVLAVVIRWGSFSASVIDHDESTYIVGADELLRGEVYLRDVIDTKPVGIFWLYALFIRLTGGGIVMLRLVATAFIALGAWLISLVVRRATGRFEGGVLAGVVYVFLCSLYTYYGMSPNTELYFNVFTIAAVAVSVVAERKRWWLAGLLLGLGCTIKPFVAAEALAIGLYLVWHYRREPWRMIGRGLTLVGTFLIPLAGVTAYFAARGLLPELWFYTVEVGGAYPVDLPWILRFKYMADYLLRCSPLILLGVVAQVRGQLGTRQRSWLNYLALQTFLVAIVVMLPGKRFGHYQIQLHPIVAMYVGTCVGLYWTEILSRVRVAWMVGLAALALGIGHAVYYAGKEDQPRQITEQLEAVIGPDETFFGVNGFQIVYHLLDRPVPVPYVHGSLLYLDHHIEAFGIDVAANARRLIEDPQVNYLLKRNGDVEAETALTDTLLQYFEPYRHIEPCCELYRRKSMELTAVPPRFR